MLGPFPVGPPTPAGLFVAKMDKLCTRFLSKSFAKSMTRGDDRGLREPEDNNKINKIEKKKQ